MGKTHKYIDGGGKYGDAVPMVRSMNESYEDYRDQESYTAREALESIKEVLSKYDFTSVDTLRWLASDVEDEYYQQYRNDMDTINANLKVINSSDWVFSDGYFCIRGSKDLNVMPSIKRKRLGKSNV